MPILVYLDHFGKDILNIFVGSFHYAASLRPISSGLHVLDVVPSFGLFGEVRFMAFNYFM